MKLATIANKILNESVAEYDDFKWDEIFDKFSGVAAELKNKWNKLKKITTPLGDLYYLVIGDELVGYCNDVGFSVEWRHFSKQYPQSLVTTTGNRDPRLIDVIFDLTSAIYQSKFKKGMKKYKTPDPGKIFGDY